MAQYARSLLFPTRDAITSGGMTRDSLVFRGKHCGVEGDATDQGTTQFMPYRGTFFDPYTGKIIPTVFLRGMGYDRTSNYCLPCNAGCGGPGLVCGWPFRIEDPNSNMLRKGNVPALRARTYTMCHECLTCWTGFDPETDPDCSDPLCALNNKEPFGVVPLITAFVSFDTEGECEWLQYLWFDEPIVMGARECYLTDCSEVLPSIESPWNWPSWLSCCPADGPEGFGACTRNTWVGCYYHESECIDIEPGEYFCGHLTDRVRGWLRVEISYSTFCCMPGTGETVYWSVVGLRVAWQMIDCDDIECGITGFQECYRCFVPLLYPGRLCAPPELEIIGMNCCDNPPILSCGVALVTENGPSASCGPCTEV